MEGGDFMLEFWLPTCSFSLASDVVRSCVSSFLSPWGFDVALFVDTFGHMDHTISAMITWVLAEAKNARHFTQKVRGSWWIMSRSRLLSDGSCGSFDNLETLLSQPVGEENFVYGDNT
jgi:hypothetical protein